MHWRIHKVSYVFMFNFLVIINLDNHYIIHTVFVSFVFYLFYYYYYTIKDKSKKCYSFKNVPLTLTKLLL